MSVNRECLSGNLRCFAGGKEQDGIRDLPRRHKGSHRTLTKIDVSDFLCGHAATFGITFNNAINSWAADATRAHSVYANLVLTKLHGPGLGQADQPPFAGSVGGAHGHAEEARSRGYVDDRSATSSPE